MSEPKYKNLTIYVPIAAYKDMEAGAEKRGMSVSKYLRTLVSEAKNGGE